MDSYQLCNNGCLLSKNNILLKKDCLYDNKYYFCV